MGRMAHVAGACLLGGLLAVGVAGGLHGRTQAVAVAAATASPGDVVINEVAWAGHAGHTADEWLELYNTTAQTVPLAGWRLDSSDGGPSITLDGAIPPHGYYLIERSNDETVSDVPADWTGSFGNGLSNAGEVLALTDSLGNPIDTANGENGGAWPAGTSSSGAIPYATMERVDPAAPDADANWCTNDGATRNGLGAGGAPINGTPKAQNSCYRPPTSNVADLAVEKSGPAAAGTGGPITYTIALHNAGALTATGVVVTDVLPAAVDFVAQISPFPFARSGRDLVWWVGNVLTGTRHLITVTGRVNDAGAGSFTNRVTATTTASETAMANNAGAWTVALLPDVRLYAVAPVNYAGLSREAAALINTGPHTVSLDGWRLNDDPNAAGGVSFPLTATIGPGQFLWLAQDGDGFYPVWGFDAHWAAQAITRPVPRLSGDWPSGLLADHGDATYLLDAGGNVVDALAYGTGLAAQGWYGPAAPYPYPGYGEGQVLYRKLDQATGRPVLDTDRAADWAQDPEDPIGGRRLRYPGWDLEEMFFPAEISATAHLTLAAAPEGTLDVVSQTIRSAQHSLRIQAYTLESMPLYQVLSDRIQSGVAVTVLLESQPAGGIEDVQRWIVQRLHNPPTSTVYFIGRTGARYRFQHAKFILVDERLALVSTDNLGENSLPSDRKDNGTAGHRGFVAVTDSPGVVAHLAEIFRRDYDPAHHLDVVPYDETYAPPDGFILLPPPDWTTYTAPFTRTLATTATHVTVLHAPEHALRDQDGLLGLLGRAGGGGEIAAMQMNEPFTWTATGGPAGLNPRLQALVAAARRGADVRVLLDEYYDDPQGANGNTASCTHLNRIAAAEGLSLACRLANVTGLGIHAKVFLVRAGDERWVHLGSINGTEAANKQNREVALQFHSAEGYTWMQAIFEHDWAAGHSPLPHHVCLPLLMREWTLPADHPLVSEIFVNPAGDDAGREWIELYNPGPEVGLAGWTLGDALAPGNYGDGRYGFPASARLARGQVLVVAACATDFSAAYGFNPAYEWGDCDPSVPNLAPVGAWEGFGLALGNERDEVLLLDTGGRVVDSTAWGGTSRAGVTPFTGFTGPFPAGASLKRYPPSTDRDDCARDFYVSSNPSPGLVAGD